MIWVVDAGRRHGRRNEGEFRETEKTCIWLALWMDLFARTARGWPEAPAQRHRRPSVAGSLLPRSCLDPCSSPFALPLLTVVARVALTTHSSIAAPQPTYASDRLSFCSSISPQSCMWKASPQIARILLIHDVANCRWDASHKCVHSTV